MRHPFEKVDTRRLQLAYWILLPCTAFFFYMLQVTSVPMNAKTGPRGEHYGGFQLETAKTPQQVERIFEAWGDEGKRAAIVQTWWGFPLLFCYGNLNAIAILAVLSRAGATPGIPKGGIYTFGRILAYGQWLGAAADGAENIMLFIQLYGQPASPWPQIAWAASCVKFTMIALCILFLLIGLPLRWSQRDPAI